MNHKRVCVHGHFRQPFRESPWLEAVEPEDSAAPWTDWNARLASECYGPNAFAASYDAAGRVAGLSSNYEWMSFDFSPALLAWLERERPFLYASILEADRRSAERRGGHGNALAHPYAHVPLPACGRRDKETLVRWGLADFRRRFRREAEGLWLPESAVDDETLEVLVAEGVGFTILDPSRALRLRAAGGGEGDWHDAGPGPINPTRPYRWVSRERPGRYLAVFFYHAGLRDAVLAENALADPATLARRVAARYVPDDSAQLVSFATDGEHYGHGRRDGARSLSALARLLPEHGAEAVNYAQFLELFPPPEEIQLKQDAPPRHEALDALAAGLDRLFEEKGRAYFADPWGLRDAWIERVLDPSSETLDRLLKRHARRHLSPAELPETLKLMELQRHRLLALDGSGTLLSLKRAARALELAGKEGETLEAAFIAALARRQPSEPGMANEAETYAKLAKPSSAGLARAAAHYAILDHLGETAEPYVFDVRLEKPQGAPARLRLRHRLTAESLETEAEVLERDRLDVACLIGGAEFTLESLFSRERRTVLRLLACGPAHEPRRRYLELWMTAVRRLQSGADPGDEVMGLLERCGEHRLLPQELPEIEAARRAFCGRLHAALAEPATPRLSALLRWLEASAASPVQADPWELQGWCWTWGRALDSRPAAERDLWRAIASRLNFSDELLASR